MPREGECPGCWALDAMGPCEDPYPMHKLALHCTCGKSDLLAHLLGKICEAHTRQFGRRPYGRFELAAVIAKLEAKR